MRPSSAMKKEYGLVAALCTGLLLIVHSATAFSILSSRAPDPSNDVYVNPVSGSPTGRGSQTDPVDSLQTGLALLKQNGQLVLAAGTYSGADNSNLNIVSGCEISIVYVDGPFTDVKIELPSDAYFVWVQSSARLQLSGVSVSYGGGSSTTSGVIQVDGSASINECSFSGAYGSSVIYVNSTVVDENTVSLQVSKSDFFNNTAPVGGAIYIENLQQATSSSINNCTFSQNVALKGAGAIYSTQSIVIQSSLFSRNAALAESGGAIFFHRVGQTQNHNFTVQSCNFYSNTAADRGGAIFVLELNGAIIGTDFGYNEASVYGGALFAENVLGAGLKVNTCTLLDNFAVHGLDSVYLLNSSVTLNNPGHVSGRGDLVQLVGVNSVLLVSSDSSWSCAIPTLSVVDGAQLHFTQCGRFEVDMDLLHVTDGVVSIGPNLQLFVNTLLMEGGQIMSVLSNDVVVQSSASFSLSQEDSATQQPFFTGCNLDSIGSALMDTGTTLSFDTGYGFTNNGNLNLKSGSLIRGSLANNGAVNAFPGARIQLNYVDQSLSILAVFMSNQTSTGILPFWIEGEAFVDGQLLVSFDPTTPWKENTRVAVVRWSSLAGQFQLIQEMNTQVDYEVTFDVTQQGVYATMVRKQGSHSGDLPGWSVFLIVSAVILTLGGAVAGVMIYLRRKRVPAHDYENVNAQEDGLLEDRGEHLGDYGAL